MMTLTDRLNAIRERAEAAYRFPASTSKQAASAADVLPLLEAVEEVLEKASRMTVYAESTDYWGGVRASGDEILAALTDKLGAGDEQ